MRISDWSSDVCSSDLPFSGNIGLRWVKTDITSIGSRQPYVITIDTAGDSYSVDPDPNGELLINRATGSYTYFLPSAHIAVDLSQEVKLPPAAHSPLAPPGIEHSGPGIPPNPPP